MTDSCYTTCNTPDLLLATGGSLSPHELEEAVAAWRSDVEAHRRAETPVAAPNPPEVSATPQGPPVGPPVVSCETCAKQNRGTAWEGECVHVEEWVLAFHKAGGRMNGMDCSMYAPDPRARWAGVQAMEVRDEH